MNLKSLAHFAEPYLARFFLLSCVWVGVALFAIHVYDRNSK